MFSTIGDTAHKKSELFRKFQSYCEANGLDLPSRNILIVQSSVKESPLIHLLRTHFRADENYFSGKKIYFLYIIGTRHDKTSDMEEQKLISAMAKQTEKFGYNSYIVTLPKPSFFAYTNSEFPRRGDLGHIPLNQSWDNTTIEDMESKLYNKLIVSTAINLNCNLILFNDLKTDLATTFLNNIVLGQTTRKSLRDHYVEHNNLQFLFPMEIFSEQEITTYFQLFDHSGNKSSIASTNQLRSIQDITAKFILKLNRDASPNISTIQKLYKKIDSNYSEIQRPTHCTFCYSLIDTGVMPRQISSDLCCNFSMFTSVTGKQIAIPQILLDEIYDETVSNSYPYSTRSEFKEHCQCGTDLLNASEEFHSNVCYIRCIVLQNTLSY